MKALHLHAGPQALVMLRERGLRPEDVAALPAAAGGPKGLVLNPLDQYLFGEWLPRSTHAIHLLGVSIGAWRMAAACLPDPVAALRRVAYDYIRETYEHAPGRQPAASVVTRVFGERLHEHFAGQEAEVLGHRRYRLHVFTSRGRNLLQRHGRLRTPLGYLAAYATNALHRPALGAWLERVVFSDMRERLPLALHDYRTRQVALSVANLRPSLLASCSIPFWLDAVSDIPGAPRGTYWDGGLTDYHLHLDYASLQGAGPRLVLYPHFQRQVVPGWLDKALRHRHRATARLGNVVVLAPNPEWVRTLPNAKLPDRSDFKRYADDEAGRMRAWQRALDESERLRDEFAELAQRGGAVEAQPL